MKKILIVCSMLLIVAMVPNAYANFSGSYNFEGTFSNFFVEADQAGNGNLTQQTVRSRAEYTCSAGTGDDYHEFTWTPGVANYGSANADWTVSADVAAPSGLTSGSPQQISIGLQIALASDPAKWLQVGIGCSDFGVGESHGLFKNDFNGDFVMGVDVASASIRIRYVASEDKMYSEYLSGTWQTIQATDVSPWSASGDSAFTASIYGGGNGVTYAGTGVYLDNFSAVPEPSSVAFFGFGLLGLAGAGWRKFRKQ